MEKRSLIAIVLSLLILIAYQEIISYLYPPAQKEAPTPREEFFAPPLPSPAPTLPAESVLLSREKADVREVKVENDVYTALFSSLGGRLKSFRLKRYRTDIKKGSPPLEMIIPGDDGELPLGVELTRDGTIEKDDLLVYQAKGGDLHLHGNEEGSLMFIGQGPGDLVITKTFSFTGEGYGFKMEVLVAGAVEDKVSEITLKWARGSVTNQHEGFYGFSGVEALLGRKLIKEKASDLTKGKLLQGEVRWAGYADTYFLAAAVPPDEDSSRLQMEARGGTIETRITTSWSPQKEPVSYTLYVGPKELDALNAVDRSLSRAVDLGWFSFIAIPLLYLLRLSNSLTGNYGADIVLLTVLVKVLFLPLTNKSFKSMSDMKKLQPQLERIRARYQNDREQMNKETMELYRRHKVNPLGGCLPMLLQLPVFIGLYQVLMQAIELRHAPFLGWINDLSQPDRLGTLAIPFVNPPGIPVLTLLMGGTMFLQQWMTPPVGDPTQQRLMMFMPLMFTVMFVNFPAGLVLYWLTNNVLSIAHQYVWNKVKRY